MRKWIDFYLRDKEKFTEQLLKWGDSKDPFIVLNSNRDTTNNHSYKNYDLIAASGEYKRISCQSDNCFEKLRLFSEKTEDWLFGYLTYDLKNEIEKLKSDKDDGLEFPELYFFVPEYIFLIKNDKLDIGYLTELSCSTSAGPIFYEIETFVQETDDRDYPKIEINKRFSKKEYASLVY